MTYLCTFLFFEGLLRLSDYADEYDCTIFISGPRKINKYQKFDHANIFHFAVKLYIRENVSIDFSVLGKLFAGFQNFVS